MKRIVKKVSLKKQKDKGKDKAIVLVGENAKLLTEACRLDKDKKAADKRIKKIKLLLDLTEGTYENKAGDELVISTAAKYSEIEPEKLFNKFVKNKMKGRFFSIVKVQVGPLAKVIPESAIKRMRKKLDPTIKWSFK